MVVHLNQEDWQAKLSESAHAQIIDVRTAEEVAEGYIPNMIHLDIYGGQEFMASLESLDKARPYFVYCKSGGRSAQACDIMQALGFSETYNLLGGFSSWTGPKEI
jgi:rhodanese-related sulfurtransferase